MSATKNKTEKPSDKGKSIVIVESPAKTRTLRNFLGEDFEILASMGHVRDLPKKEMGVDIEKDFIRGAVMDALVEALEELPAEQRDVFIQQAIEGKAFREISEESGVALNTLIARKRYAVQFLRERLQDIKELVDELA